MDNRLEELATYSVNDLLELLAEELTASAEPLDPRHSERSVSPFSGRGSRTSVTCYARAHSRDVPAVRPFFATQQLSWT